MKFTQYNCTFEIHFLSLNFSTFSIIIAYIFILLYFFQCEEIIEEHEETIISLLQEDVPKLERVFCTQKSNLCHKKKSKTEL